MLPIKKYMTLLIQILQFFPRLFLSIQRLNMDHDPFSILWNSFGIKWAYLDLKCMPLLLCLSETNLQYCTYNIIEPLVTAGRRISCASTFWKNSNRYSCRLSAIVASNVPADTMCVSVIRRTSKILLRILFFISHSMSINSPWTVWSYTNSIRMSYVPVSFPTIECFHKYFPY